MVWNHDLTAQAPKHWDYKNNPYNWIYAFLNENLKV